MKRPKSQGQTRFLKETPKLFNLGELWLIHYFSMEKTTLNPKKANSKYNDL
ncbi:cag pathogenicity island protein [Helicobacter pylori]|nr:cag pathogenicity island protein [Helicobacter pylori]